MTISNYLLVVTEIGMAEEVVTELTKLKEVKRANFVTGPYDVIALVEVPDLTDLNTLISGRVHRIPDIQSTHSCIVMGNANNMQTFL